jgi:hypothetical protein
MSDRRNKEDLHTQEDDPYASVAQESSNVLQDSKTESARSRKWKQFKQKLEMAKSGMYQGFLMGAMVGGGFGLVFGLYNAIVYKQFIMIPLATITSAGSFGFFMACGSLIRSQPYKYNPYDLYNMENPPAVDMVVYNTETNKIEGNFALWKLKYMAQSC